jgi:hypothetical protein
MDKQTSKPRKDFYRYGCLIGLVLLLMIVLGGLFGLYSARKMFNDFTDNKPEPLPQLRLSRAEINEVQLRIDSFRKAVREGKTTEPLRLSADEINALIETDPDLNPLRGKFYVTSLDKQLQGQLRVPMESIGLPVFKGRYLNGTGTFELSLHNDRLRLNAISFLAKGKRIPEIYMNQIRKHNFVEGLNNDPRAAAALNWLQEIKVQDGKLVLFPKQKQ